MPGLLDLVFPPHCVLCRRRSVPLCDTCAAMLVPALPRDHPEGLDGLWALTDHDEGGRELVTSLKYDGRRDAVGLLGTAMAHLVDRPVDVVTWAPTSPSRRRRRGFDQAQLLATSAARALATPRRRLLDRPEGRAQTGADREQRLRGPAFVPHRTTTGSVLVVDDVITTGATLSAAASTLRAAGATEVLGLTLSSVA